MEDSNRHGGTPAMNRAKRPHYDYVQADRNCSSTAPNDSQHAHAGVNRSVELCESCSRLKLESPPSFERFIGTLDFWMQHECPFAELILEGVKLAWGPSWSHSTLGPSPEASMFIKGVNCITMPKSVGRAQAQGPSNILVAITEKPPHITLSQTGKRKVDGLTNRYIILELESYDNGLRQLLLSDKSSISLPKRRSIGPVFDCSLAKNWIGAEIKNTKRRKVNTPETIDQSFWGEPGLRLIDLENECLVVQKFPCKYAALSYVWGAAAESSLRLSNSNAARLSIPGALAAEASALAEDAPMGQTIRDAMTLTREIGLQFLWVDAICIMQDNEQERRRLIHGMDGIYEEAVITIVGVAGTDVTSGLHGISKREHLPYENHYNLVTEGKQPLHLMLSRPSLVDQVRKSRWNSRGWTYQEQSLSHRCLYFTPDEVFYVDRKVQFREGYEWEDSSWWLSKSPRLRTGPPWWSDSIKRDPDPSPYRPLVGANPGLGYTKFEHMVRDYCRKELTIAGDVLNAFQGIINRFCRPSDKWSDYCQSIPLHFCPPALLWYPLDGTIRRALTSPEPLQVTLSSWSWASWSGPVDFVFSSNSGLNKGMQSPTIAFELWNATSLFKTSCLDVAEVGRSSREKGPFHQASSATLSDASEIDKQQRESLVYLARGVLQFTAPYLRANVTFTKTDASAHRVLEFSLPSLTDRHGARGNFRFDDNGSDDEGTQPMCLIAMIMGVRYMIIVLGVREIDGADGTLERVGVGSIYPEKGDVNMEWLEDLGFHRESLKLR